MAMTSHFFNMKPPSIFFDVLLLLLSDLVTGTIFISISQLIPDLWQFVFIKDWPEIRKLEIASSGFCPISEDWVEYRIPNLARTCLIKWYWMLQNISFTTFTEFTVYSIYSLQRFWVIKGKPAGRSYDSGYSYCYF